MQLLKSALTALALLAVLASSAHAKQDPVTPKATKSSFIATYKTYTPPTEAEPYATTAELVAARLQRMKSDVRYLLLIKNGISLYRKGALNDRQFTVLRWFIQEVGKSSFELIQLKRHGVTPEQGFSLTPEEYELAELFNAYCNWTYSISMSAPDMVLFFPRTRRPLLDVADETYRDAVQKSQALGIEQVWIESK